MDEVLQYLEMKNHYYEKFFSVTEKFLEKISKNDWDQTEFFVDSRERILSIIKSFDVKIQRELQRINSNYQLTESERSLLEKISKEKKKAGDKILELDLRLISAIDDYKNETIKELQKTVKAQQHIGAFEKTGNSTKRSSPIGKA